MAKFFKDAAGEYGLRADAAEEARAPIPAGSEVVTFDPATNPKLLDALQGKLPGATWQQFTIVGGVVFREGMALVIAPDGPAMVSKQKFLATAAAVATQLDAGTAVLDPALQLCLAALVRDLLART